MKDFQRAKKRINSSSGESVEIMRELQELSQNELAWLSNIPQSTISAIENDRVNLGIERGKSLARALKCHPASLPSSSFRAWKLKTRAPHKNIQSVTTNFLWLHVIFEQQRSASLMIPQQEALLTV